MTPTKYFTDEDEITEEDLHKSYVDGVKFAITEFKAIIDYCPFELDPYAAKWLKDSLDDL